MSDSGLVGDELRERLAAVLEEIFDTWDLEDSERVLGNPHSAAADLADGVLADVGLHQTLTPPAAPSEPNAAKEARADCDAACDEEIDQAMERLRQIRERVALQIAAEELAADPATVKRTDAILDDYRQGKIKGLTASDIRDRFAVHKENPMTDVTRSLEEPSFPLNLYPPELRGAWALSPESLSALNSTRASVDQGQGNTLPAAYANAPATGALATGTAVGSGGQASGPPHRHLNPSPSHTVVAWCNGTAAEPGCFKAVPLHDFADGPHVSYFQDCRVGEGRTPPRVTWGANGKYRIVMIESERVVSSAPGSPPGMTATPPTITSIPPMHGPPPNALLVPEGMTAATLRVIAAAFETNGWTGSYAQRLREWAGVLAAHEETP